MRYSEFKLSKQAYDGQAAWAAGRNAERKQQQAQQREMYNMPQAELHRLTRDFGIPLDLRRRVLAERKRRMQGGVYAEALQQAQQSSATPSQFGAGDKINGQAKVNARAKAMRQASGAPDQAASGWSDWRPYWEAGKHLVNPLNWAEALEVVPAAVTRTAMKLPGALYKTPSYISNAAGRLLPGAIAAVAYGSDADTAKAAWDAATGHYDQSLLGRTMNEVHNTGNAVDRYMTKGMVYPDKFQNMPEFVSFMNNVEDIGAAVAAPMVVKSVAQGPVRKALEAQRKAAVDQADRSSLLLQRAANRDISRGNIMAPEEIARRSGKYVVTRPGPFNGHYNVALNKSRGSAPAILHNEATVPDVINGRPNHANAYLVRPYTSVYAPDGTRLWGPGQTVRPAELTAATKKYGLPDDWLSFDSPLKRHVDAATGNISYTLKPVPYGYPMHEALGPSSHLAQRLATGRVPVEGLRDPSWWELLWPGRSSRRLGAEWLAHAPGNEGVVDSLIGRSNYWNTAYANWLNNNIQGLDRVFGPVPAASSAGGWAQTAAEPGVK